MQRVPGRVHLVSGKRIPGHAPLGNDRAVELLDGDPVGGEHGALIRRAIRRDGRSLFVQPYGHAARICVLQDALQGKEAAATDNGGLNLVVATPALQTAVRIENFRQQLVHGFPFQSSSAIAGISKRSRVRVYQPPSMRPIRSSFSASTCWRAALVTASSYMDHQDLAEHQAKAAKRDFLHEGAFHRDRRFGDAGNADPHRGRQRQPGFVRLLDALGKRDRRDAHLSGQCERHQIDDELLVGANIGAGVLWLSRSLAADANADCRGVAAKDIEERKRRGVDCAGGVAGRHPCDRSWQNRREQQSVAFERTHRFEIKLHGLLRSLVARPIRFAVAVVVGQCVDVAADFNVEALALMLYRGAETALESLPDMAWRAASYRSQSALSASDGMVTTSPWSSPARAASTMSSA